MDLIAPSLDLLPSYRAALRRGWSSEAARTDLDAAAADLDEVDRDPEKFVALLNHPLRGDARLTLPDGQVVPRLPGVRRWMSDGEYCGAINLRWQPGTSDLPPYVLGHIGYAVVPWKRGRGYATEALGQMLGIARELGLDHVDLVTSVDNTASQDVILANGGAQVGAFVTPPAHGSYDALLFRISLWSGTAPST